MSSANAVSLDQCKNMSFAKELTLYQTTIFFTSNSKHSQDEQMYDNKKELKFLLGKVENIMEKEENDGYQHFLLFPNCFQKALSSGLVKVGIVW